MLLEERGRGVCHIGHGYCRVQEKSADELLNV